MIYRSRRKEKEYIYILHFLIFILCSTVVIFCLVPAYVKAEETASTRHEFIQIVYEHMVRQEENIVVEYEGNDYKEIHEQFLNKILPEEIYTIDRKDTSDDADYMIYNLEKIEIHTRTELIGNARFTFKLKWKENQKQTKEVNKKVKQILKELDLEKDSNYIKVKKIHDYIIDNVSYDNSLTCFTTYDALFKGEATCQGYMLLSYKMLTEAGVDTKCIDGIGISQGVTENHGWNIVKLGDKWYNLDATWDDPVIYRTDGSITEEGKKKFQYDYFLKGRKNFDERHRADKKFKTKEFKEKYPISEKDFSKDEYEQWRAKNKEKTIKEIEKSEIKEQTTSKKRNKDNIDSSNSKKNVNFMLIFLSIIFVFRMIKLFFKE